MPKKTQNQADLQQRPRVICTHVLRLAVRKAKLVARGIAHTPETGGVRGQMTVVVLNALKLVFKSIRH